MYQDMLLELHAGGWNTRRKFLNMEINVLRTGSASEAWGVGGVKNLLSRFGLLNVEWTDESVIIAKAKMHILIIWTVYDVITFFRPFFNL